MYKLNDYLQECILQVGPTTDTNTTARVEFGESVSLHLRYMGIAHRHTELELEYNITWNIMGSLIVKVDKYVQVMGWWNRTIKIRLFILLRTQGTADIR